MGQNLLVTFFVSYHVIMGWRITFDAVVFKEPPTTNALAAVRAKAHAHRSRVLFAL